MTFNSPAFFLFLTFIVGVNYFLSQRFRLLFLLFASFVFIGSHNLESLVALLFFSLFNFYVARKITGNRFLYFIGVLLNILAIILFNYFNITPFGLNFAFSYVSFHVDSFIIALGLSFYSLQNIAYLTEVYHQRMKPEMSVSKYVLYCGFFPKIISGPIMLPTEFLSQNEKKSITKEQLISGFQRLLLGLFKKMVIADRLAPAVNSIFDYGDNYSGLTTLVGAYLFTVQLYFDFSGYSDMALGIAKVLGYNLKENFILALRSTSVSEFWRRWHISLITWFTNYIYYPVVYRFRTYKKTAAIIAIAFTFIISAIWHGIGFTFIVWALCHVAYLSFEVLTKRFRVGLSENINGLFYKIMSAFVVFNIVCFSNIFFRAETMETAFQLIHNIYSCFIPTEWLSDFIAPLAIGGHQLEEFNFYISILITGIVILYERRINRIGESEKLNVGYIVACTLLIMLFGVFDSGARFIYMQF